MSAPRYLPARRNHHRLKSAGMGDVIGSFGYPGDVTPDSNSLRGVGAYCQHMIPGYSAGLTREAGRMRGIKPGQEFEAGGRIFRWDDTAPKRQVVHGRVIIIPDNYVDVYEPNHAPDKASFSRHGHRHAAKGPGSRA